MVGPRGRVLTAEAEAAEWHARLGARFVSSRDIEEFFAWRKTAANEDAYRRVEAIWGQTAKLGSDPQIAAATEAVLSRRRPEPRRPSRAVLVGAFAGVGAALAIACFGFGWWRSQPVFGTVVGEQRMVQLADGSSVRLDTDSRIRVRFSQNRRAIALEGGQALFSVAHDPSRPFVVEAGDTRVTAVGTVFDVRRDPAGAKVTLVSGIVDVTAAGGAETRRMEAGHQAVVRAGETRISAVDVGTQTSWADGRIVFRDTPLRTAVDEINRYLTHKVELGGGASDDVLVNGVFRAGDREAFVSAVSEVFDLQAVRRSDGAVQLTERVK